MASDNRGPGTPGDPWNRYQESPCRPQKTPGTATLEPRVEWGITTPRFQAAVAAFTSLNAADPGREPGDGGARLLVQAQRLAGWVERLDPGASEALRLAAHCQHLERWKIARTEFPAGRAGYLQWRTRLGRYHAERAREVLSSLGYAEEEIKAVERIVTKQNLRSNPDSQTMEDALCLVFLEHELEEFIQKYPDEAKAIDILQKTWKKMSARAHEAALTLPLSGPARVLVGRALAPATGA